MRELGGMTFEEARGLDRSRCVAILPVGAIEAHGPHLPLATDVVIAEAMAREGARRLEAHGWTGVRLPALPYTAAPFGAAFAGTLSIPGAAVAALVEALASELARHGFAALAIANAHLDPAHLECLTAAAGRIRERGGIAVAFPDLTRRPWAGRLGEEFRSGACHAGRFEGSVVMAERPDLVRDAERLALPANPASLSEAIRAGRTDFAAAGGPRAYFGAPADATAEEGRATVATLGAILAEATLEALGARA